MSTVPNSYNDAAGWFAPENQSVVNRFFSIAEQSTKNLENSIVATSDVFNEKIGFLLNSKELQGAITDMKSVLLKEKGASDSYVGFVSSFVENLEKTKAELEQIKRLETVKSRWFTASILFVAIGALPGLSLVGSIGLISLVTLAVFQFMNLGNKINSKTHISLLNNSFIHLNNISDPEFFGKDSERSKRIITFHNLR